MAEMDGAGDISAEQNASDAAMDTSSEAGNEAASAGEDPAGGGLPDWAVRQLGEVASETEAAAAVVADDGGPSDTGGDDDLPDWAKKKMAQMSAPPAPTTPPPVQLAPEELATPPALPTVPPELKAKAPNLEMMLDLPLDVTVELGRAEMPLANVLGLKAGSVVQLDKLPGEPLDLFVNGQLVAQGEIVVLNDTFAFRITDLIED